MNNGKTLDRLGDLSRSLTGVAGLFQAGSREIPLQNDELNGIGNLLYMLSNELLAVEDILRGNAGHLTLSECDGEIKNDD